MDFVVATSNKGKLKEIREILKSFSFDIVTMQEVGFHEEIEENGLTFEENALIKARAVALKLKNQKQTSQAFHAIIMADDSGLEVDYLKGAPGIYSARYSGEGAKDENNVKKLLSELEGVPLDERKARFVCVIALVFQDGKEITVRGECEGKIAFEPKGINGFGYDPVFYVSEFDKTMAELDSDQKNAISHRGKALLEMKSKLEEMGI